jgi:phage-related protein
MAGLDQLSTYVIMIMAAILATVISLWFLLGNVQSKATFISTRLGSAFNFINSFVGQTSAQIQDGIETSTSFLNHIWGDIDTALQAAVNSFDQLIDTIGSALVDVINFIATGFQQWTQNTEFEINQWFSNLLQPLTDSLTLIIQTVAQIIGDFVGVFNPHCS